MTATARRLPPAIEDLAITTLSGDVRSFLMNHVKHMPKAWPTMSEREQKAFAEATTKQAEWLVGAVTELVNAQGREYIEISVGDLQKKAGQIVAKFTTPYSRDALGDLAEAGETGPLVLSLLSKSTFFGERAPAKIMPDQPDLMDDVDPETGEVLSGEVLGAQQGDADAGELAQDAAEEQDATIGASYAAERAAAGADEPGDALAAGAQQDAMTDAAGPAPTDAAHNLTDDEWNALGPAAQANIDRLSQIKPLDADEAETAEAVPADGPKKRRGRRTMEQRQADEDAARAAHQAGRAQAERRAE